MARLLVSVRSAAEALIALEGGAALIDVKEPGRGSLGRADDAVIAEVVQMVGGRRPVSAALGEWIDGEHTIPDFGLSYAKWGLAGCRNRPSWKNHLDEGKLARPTRVFVAYADWECAVAPSIEVVFSVASQRRGGVLLVDTHCKDATNVHKNRPTLLDWMRYDSIIGLCERAHQAEIKIALAGSLGIEEIRQLLPARPDWFAVRGAVCDGADRQASVELERVRDLVKMLECAG